MAFILTDIRKDEIYIFYLTQIAFSYIAATKQWYTYFFNFKNKFGVDRQNSTAPTFEIHGGDEA